MPVLKTLCLCALAIRCDAFSPVGRGTITVLNQVMSSTSALSSKPTDTSRRQLITQAGSGLASAVLLPFLVFPQKASAGIDPNALKSMSVEGDNNGSMQRLRQLQEEKTRPEDTVDKPFEKLDGGISYREYREGKGDAIVTAGSKVAAEMTIRCKSFSTANEPGGLKYYSTKDDTDFNELAWTIGSGELVPGLEDAMVGMRKGSIRRIEVPSTAVFAARDANQLPLPKASNKDGNRRLSNLFKTDATLIFEVLVTRIK